MSADGKTEILRANSCVLSEHQYSSQHNDREATEDPTFRARFWRELHNKECARLELGLVAAQRFMALNEVLSWLLCPLLAGSPVAHHTKTNCCLFGRQTKLEFFSVMAFMAFLLLQKLFTMRKCFTLKRLFTPSWYYLQSTLVQFGHSYRKVEKYPD